MKKINYKVGDIVALVDGVHYKYLGFNRRRGVYLYEPIEPQADSIFSTLTDEACEKCKVEKGTVPFARKVDLNIKIIRKYENNKLQ